MIAINVPLDNWWGFY